MEIQSAPSFPGLTPVSKKLTEALSEYAAVEAKAYQVDQMRQTLLMSFGNVSTNTFGFYLVDNQRSTHDLMVAALMQLCKRAPVGATEGETREEA